MTGDIFLKWMKHFKECANPSEDSKVVLIPDGHSSHKPIDILRVQEQRVAKSARELLALSAVDEDEITDLKI
jgi:hypothetical protein